MDLAGRKAMTELSGDGACDVSEFSNPRTEAYQAMVDRIRERLGLTSLRYQTLGAMIEAIGLPRDKLCTFCWSGESLYE
jgi:amidophosphoribosyltransferase